LRTTWEQRLIVRQVALLAYKQRNKETNNKQKNKQTNKQTNKQPEYSLKTTLSSARNIENGKIGTSGLVKEAFTDHDDLSR